MSAQYVSGAVLADLAVTWLDDAGDVIDFSSGWTFSVKVGAPNSTASFTKTTGITGAATAPNVTIEWATSGEITTLGAGSHTVQITATRSADSKPRRMQARLDVVKAVL